MSSWACVSLKLNPKLYIRWTICDFWGCLEWLFCRLSVERCAYMAAKRPVQVRLEKEFCEGTGYSAPHEAIAAGVKSLDDWLDLVERHREDREANPLPRGPGFARRRHE